MQAVVSSQALVPTQQSAPHAVASWHGVVVPLTLPSTQSTQVPSVGQDWEGMLEGMSLGVDDGASLGMTDGVMLGDADGMLEGISLGDAEGELEGISLGVDDGTDDGAELGASIDAPALQVT